MSGVQIALAALAALLGSTVLAAAITAGVSYRLGVRADERGARQDEASGRRDTIADRDALIDQLSDGLADERTAREALAVRVDALERQREADRVYIDELRAHIWAGKPPPPPDRHTLTD